MCEKLRRQPSHSRTLPNAYGDPKSFLTAVRYTHGRMIAPELAGFLEQGLGIHVGTRDVRLRPLGCRGLAARVEFGGKRMVVYVPKSAGVRIQTGLEEAGQVAVSFGRPEDDRACQVKGIVLDTWDATADEQPVVAAQWDGYLRQLERIGIPRAISANWQTWPAFGIRLRVTAVFEQTPGPQAGAPFA